MINEEDTENETPHLGPAQLEAYEIVKFESPESWRLTTRNETDTEAVFRVRGILCAFELPPLTNIQNAQRMRHYIRQGVTLTGLSTDPFSKATSTCDAIYAMLLTHFPDGSMINWENTMYEGHIATNFSARYFTNRNLARNEVNLPFGDGVDPNGVLANVRGQDLIHGPDNQVTYVRRLKTGSYQAIQPACFQLGDVVEVTVAFVVLPLRGGKYVMTPQMRALVLLEKECQVQRDSGNEVIPCKQMGQLKRKALHVTEKMVVEIREKLAKMDIDAKEDKH